MSGDQGPVARLGELLDQVVEPVYLLDAARTIVYGNRALAEWTGVAIGRLIGRPVEYHSAEAPGIAAGLCPPPSAFAGCEATGHVSCMSAEGRLRHRLARFIPLRAESDGAAGTSRGVLALVAAADEEMLGSPPDGRPTSTDQLHVAIRRFRAAQAKEYAIARLIGDSPAMVRVRRQAELAAQASASVLIVGPPGSGRSHIARTIHYQRSAAPQPPLVPIDARLLTPELLRRTPPAAGAARGSGASVVWLLEDVDQLPVDTQLPLAERLGRESPIDRVLATARKRLDLLAQEDRFHPELAFALSTLVIEVPPLSHRVDDLPVLAQLLLEEANRGAARQVEGLAPAALDLLANYPWPGGIDELAQVMRAAHRVARDAVILPQDLPSPLRHATDALRHPRPTEQPIVLDEVLGQLERALITRALDQAKGNKARAARLLGLSRPRLYRRMVQLGLDHDAAG